MGAGGNADHDWQRGGGRGLDLPFFGWYNLWTAPNSSDNSDSIDSSHYWVVTMVELVKEVTVVKVVTKQFFKEKPLRWKINCDEKNAAQIF